MSEDEILTIREVAEFLKVGEKTTFTMAQSGHKVRGQWRFRRADIESWITHHVAGVRCDKKKGATGGIYYTALAHPRVAPILAT